jgi:hypothetical protein
MMKNELASIRNEAVVAYFNVLSGRSDTPFTKATFFKVEYISNLPTEIISTTTDASQIPLFYFNIFTIS